MNWLKLFGVGVKSDANEFDVVDKAENPYESPENLKLAKQLVVDDIDAWDSDEIESQQLHGYVSNHEYGVVDPITIRSSIQQYRIMAETFYIEDAISKIVNDAIIEENNTIVSLDLKMVDISDKVKTALHEEWKNTLKLIKFRKIASKAFENFYRDGRAYYRMVFGDNAKEGVLGIQELDAAFVEKFIDKAKNILLYQYTDANGKIFAISENAIIALNSGKINKDRTMYVSYLHQALKPLNLLTLMVDALAIYRITRAPERRVFNISTGRLLPKKAKKYINDVIASLKSNVVYDSVTGKMSQSNKVLTMIEDFYFPKGQDDTGTTVDTLSGGAQLGEIDDIAFLERNLLKSLKIPVSRHDTDSTLSSMFGNNSSDIEKEENEFNKFIKYLRRQFRDIILTPFRLNLIIKGIITAKEWDDIEYDLNLIWSTDSNVAELKFLEKIEKRVNAVESLESYINKTFSQKWINTNIWKLTDEDVETLQKEIKDEVSKSDDDDTDDDEK
jgi:hypothetical protein